MKVQIKETGFKYLWLFCSFTAVLAIFLLCLSVRKRTYSETLLRFLKGPILYDDPELVEYIREKVLVPPSSAPYNLEGEYNTALSAPDVSENFYANVTKRIFKGKRNGFFIEAGALDGETMSNTLSLETRYNWTGLLVEADQVTYSKLLKKNRKAWSVDGCLSPHPYPTKELMTMTSHFDSIGALSAGTKTRAMHSLAKYSNKKLYSSYWFKAVHCYPLGSLLSAIGVHHVDLLVLDIEGGEMDVLRHLDLEKFIIDVIYLEWKHLKEHPKIVQIIERKGYRLFDDLAEDLVFVRNNCPYDEGVAHVLSNKTSTFLNNPMMDKLKSKGIVFVTA